MASAKQQPIVDGLFTWPSDSPKLIAGRCKACNTIFFPSNAAVHSPDCTDRQVEEKLLSTRGILVSYTIHYYQPPPPFRMEPFEPYAVGVAELPEKIQVVGMLSGVDMDDIKVGSEVELEVGKMYHDEEGVEYLTWKWRVIP